MFEKPHPAAQEPTCSLPVSILSSQQRLARALSRLTGQWMVMGRFYGKLGPGFCVSVAAHAVLLLCLISTRIQKDEGRGRELLELLTDQGLIPIDIISERQLADITRRFEVSP